MKTFKQKSLYAALAGVSALGVTSAAQAVNVNPDGLGQVLIYPYYTARAIGDGAAPYASLLTVVNSTASGKAVKVRFIEGKASQEVLDFNLFLSAKDVWTAGVLATGSGGAGVGTYDKSCVVPALPAGGGLQPFVNYLYADDFEDAVKDGSLDRTMEGYVEIIEMGTIQDKTDISKTITHVAGTPKCDPALLVPASDSPSDPVNSHINDILTDPSGGLFGDMTLINVLAGTDYSVDAIALDNFRNFSQYYSPGDVNPDLNAVSPAISVVFESGNSGYASGRVVTSNFQNPLDQLGGPVDAISALFMHDHVYNDYVLDSSTKSGTDWVLTFPTKRYYVPSNGDLPIGLFQSNLTTSGSCDDISTIIYDREEQSAKGSVGFSPPRPGSKSNQLCWEANVLTFNSSQVLGSKNNRNLNVTYQNGWVDLSFPLVTSDSSVHQLFADQTVTTDLFGFVSRFPAIYRGLPVVGFAVQSFENGNLPDGAGNLVQSNYGGNFVHKTTRLISYQQLVPVGK